MGLGVRNLEEAEMISLWRVLCETVFVRSHSSCYEMYEGVHQCSARTLLAGDVIRN